MLLLGKVRVCWSMCLPDNVPCGGIVWRHQSIWQVLFVRYLGEAPAAHNHRVLKLLGYLLSVTTEGEERLVAQGNMVVANRKKVMWCVIDL